MAYRASQTFRRPEDALDVLEQLPGKQQYRVNGSMYPRKPSVILSRHSTEEALEETYSISDRVKVTVNYSEGNVKMSGKLGLLPVSSMKASFERPSWPEFREFLDQTGDWK